VTQTVGQDAVSRRERGLDLFAAPRARRAIAARGRRSQALERLGISSVQDLLQHYPRYHVDRSELRTVRELAALASGGETGEVTVHARVVEVKRPFRTGKGRVLIKGRIADETGSIDVTWFNQEWVARALPRGAWAFFYGRLGTFRGRLQMTAPRFELVRTGKEPFNVGRIVPIYQATAELSSDALRKLMWETLERFPDIADPLPETLRRRLRLTRRRDAVRAIHFPESKEEVLAARRRLVFDEVLTLQLGPCATGSGLTRRELPGRVALRADLRPASCVCGGSPRHVAALPDAPAAGGGGGFG
jgi:ATP-dependent DNA helicase RecG